VAQAGDAATGSSATGRKRGAARLGGGLAGDEGGIWYASTPMHCEVVNGMNEVQVTRQTAGQDKKSFFKKKQRTGDLNLIRNSEQTHPAHATSVWGVQRNGRLGSRFISYRKTCMYNDISLSLSLFYVLTRAMI
jgi:hypothetical protein